MTANAGPGPKECSCGAPKLATDVCPRCGEGACMHWEVKANPEGWTCADCGRGFPTVEAWLAAKREAEAR
jgi:hypothetical protein